MRPTIIVSALAALTVSAVAAYLLMSNEKKPNTASSDSRPGYYGCSDSNDFAKISLRPSGVDYQEWHLKIPKQYLGYSKNWNGGEQSILRINASLQSLEARPTGSTWKTCATDKNQKSTSAFPDDLLQIDITAATIKGNPLLGFSKPKEEYIEVSSEFTDLISLQHKCMADLPWPPNPKKPPKNCSYEYWYTPKQQSDEQPVVIKCLGVVENPSASCDVYFSKNGHKVDYRFKRSKLSEWSSINSAVLELLTKFTETSPSS